MNYLENEPTQRLYSDVWRTLAYLDSEPIQYAN